MNQHELVQGSPEWHAYRTNNWNASDAPAMMGASQYKTRQQLLSEMATGVTPEVDPVTQRLFDDGHRSEALARPLGAEIVGEDLYPVVGSSDEVIGGRALSASLDGLTMLEDINFEHKRLNNRLRAAMHEGCTGADLPMDYQIQMEQQHMVCGAQKTLFMASEWDADGILLEERHCWYYPNPSLAAQIRAGWAQFAADLAAFTPAEPAPIATGKAPDALPALRIEVSGAVTASNLAEFKHTALTAIRSVNRELTTDQQFADAEKAVKWCSDVETRLAAAKQHALSQTSSIDELFRTMDDISEEARRVRLDLDKIIKARKEAIRGEIAAEGIKALREHIESLNARIGKNYMPAVASDFGGVIKGKRTVESLRSAVADELARAKIEASAIADRIQTNINALRERAAGHSFLFSDAAQIVLRAPDDVANLITARISDHDAKEARRIEQEREKIRQEEIAKLEREAEIRRQQEAAHAARVAATHAIQFDFPAPVPEAQPVAPLADDVVAQVAEVSQQLDVAQAQGSIAPDMIERLHVVADELGAIASGDTPAGVEYEAIPTASDVAPFAPRMDGFFPKQARMIEPASTQEPEVITNGELGEILGFELKSEFVRSLGFTPVEIPKRKGVLWRKSELDAICTELLEHIANRFEEYLGAPVIEMVA